MTPEELLKKLDELGVPTDVWTVTQEKTLNVPLLERQRKALEQVRALLELQVRKDKALAEDLYEKVERLKHGGGR